MYDPLAYWRERGRTYERDFRPERYREQEAALEELLAPLEFDSVLDVGCGFGRIGTLLYRLRPGISYRGVDASPDQVAAARRNLPIEARLSVGDLRLVEGRYDLVIASEVLMHLPDIEDTAARLLGIARRHLVTVDWDAPEGRTAGTYCFGHDYARLFPGATRTTVGRQAIWHLAR